MVRTIFIVFLNKLVDEVIRQVVTKGAESMLHLIPVNTTRSINIKCLKALLPVFYILPKSRKLVEIDCTSVV
jgi:hypothetical protein